MNALTFKIERLQQEEFSALVRIAGATGKQGI
jgi:hypothetical protein